MEGSIGLPEIVLLFLMLIPIILIILPFWKIFSKAGFSGALSLLMLIPIVNIIVLFFFSI